jgi:LysM repeat protein
MRNMKRIYWGFVILLITILITSCSPTPNKPTGSVFSGEKLTPYATRTLTPTITSTPINAPTATLAPTVTSTPRAYQVKSNDTMIVIAFKNGITLEELKAANPTIDPLLLNVGMTLYIPAPKGTSGTQAAPTPTPVPVNITGISCTTSLSGGVYCFAEGSNSQSFDLDNISAEFRLTDLQSGNVVTSKAFLPLNRLVQGKALPFFAYFPPLPFTGFTVELQLQSATAVNASGTSPLSVTLDQTKTDISADGMSASVSGKAVLGSEGDAKYLWIAAVAIDQAGKPVGIRRIEFDQKISAGTATDFNMTIYSIGGSIARVDLYGEAIR